MEENVETDFKYLILQKWKCLKLYIYKQTDIYIPHNILYILYNIYILNVLHISWKLGNDQQVRQVTENGSMLTFSHSDSSKNSGLLNSTILSTFEKASPFWHLHISLYYTMLFLVYSPSWISYTCCFSSISLPFIWPLLQAWNLLFISPLTVYLNIASAQNSLINYPNVQIQLCHTHAQKLSHLPIAFTKCSDSSSK